MEAKVSWLNAYVTLYSEAAYLPKLQQISQLLQPSLLNSPMNLPPTLQAQLASIMSQVLQYATLTATPPSTSQSMNLPITLLPTLQVQLSSLTAQFQ